MSEATTPPPEEVPERFVLTISMIVECRPSLMTAAEQRACVACVLGFQNTEVAALQSNASHFRYAPDPRNSQPLKSLHT